MKTEKYEFLHSPDSVPFHALLAHLAPLAPLAGLVIDQDLSRYSERAALVLEELAIDSESVEPSIDRWPGTRKLLSSDATRHVFYLNSHSSGVLSGSANSLFDWHNRQLPEDLHFMRADRSLVLGCVAHEEYAWLELTHEEMQMWKQDDRWPIRAVPPSSKSLGGS